jgi:hypothetical protein
MTATSSDLPATGSVLGFEHQNAFPGLTFHDSDFDMRRHAAL